MQAGSRCPTVIAAAPGDGAGRGASPSGYMGLAGGAPTGEKVTFV